MVTPFPDGGGYPAVQISAFLYTRELTCIVAADGVIILDESRIPNRIGTALPNHYWWLAGGPAVCVDYEPTEEPVWITDYLKRLGIEDNKNSGILRVISARLPGHIWNSEFPKPEEFAMVEDKELKVWTVRTLESVKEMLLRITFGAVGNVLPADYGSAEEDFWRPLTIRRIGFFNATRKQRRFINYLEATPHVDPADWDPRNIFVRVRADVRRDLFWGALNFDKLHAGGIFSRDAFDSLIFEQLRSTARVIDAFEKLLETEGVESKFHDFIVHNPMILDLYAEIKSKPRFSYPEPSLSPTGKTYVEPDFILKYPDGSYKYVEIERPGKRVKTKGGHPRRDMTQASFQIAEWRHFVSEHYDLIKTEFPGLSSNTPAWVIISRGSGKEIARYKNMLRAYCASIDALTYDDVLARARQEFSHLSALR